MRLPFLLLMVSVGIIALACTAPTQGPAAGGGSDQPKSGGVLNLRNTTDATDWNMRVNGQNANNVSGIRLAYSSLLGFKQAPHPDISYFDNAIVSELAERWEVSPDAKTYTFYLRKGVKWANTPPLNGRELTAADVKWSYEYLSSTGQFKDLPASQNSFMYEGLAGIDTPDPYTVVVRFKDGFAPFINYAGSAFNPIYAKELLELDGEFALNILGTGPFQFDKTDSQKGTRWVFKKNPTYWDADSVHLDKVRHLVIPEDATGHAAFQTRQLDILSTSSGPSISDIAAANPNALRLDFPGSPRYVLMQFEKPPLGNMKVRQAISRAIDRDEFVKVLGGQGTWGLAGSNTWVDLFTAEEMKQIYRYDVDEAKRLLAEAGFPNGVTVKMMTDLGSDTERTLIQLLQAQLKRAAITMELDQRTQSEVSADRKVGDFQMHWFGEYPRSDPDATLFGTYTPGQRLNYTRVNDPKLTQLVAAQRQEPDPKKRREIMRQAIRYLNETALGIAIDRAPNAVFWHPYVKNYAPHQDHGYASINAWLDK